MVTWLLKMKSQRCVLLAMSLLFADAFIRALTSSKDMLQVGTFLEIVAYGMIFPVIWRDENGEKINGARLAYIILLCMLVFHNIYDVANASNVNYKVFVEIYPWGLTMSCLSIFIYNSKADLKIVQTNLFQSYIVVSSFALSCLLVLVQIGELEGNTDKLSNQTGGVGLLGLSTNETALLAVCLFTHLLGFFRKKKVSIIIPIAICANILTIALTRSRIGIGVFLFLLVLYNLKNFFKRPGLTLAVGIILIICSLPLLDILLDILRKRFANDTYAKIKYVNWADKLGFTLSGRVIIWEAYLSEFYIKCLKNPFLFIFGGGYSNTIDTYKESFLPLLREYEVKKKTNFFPLHSDIILIFLNTGIVGLVCWVRLVSKALISSFERKSFLGVAFSVIIILFSAFDMLNYSILSSLLIGVGIAEIINHD